MTYYGHSTEVRRPMVAGQFYPANPVDLSKQLAQYFRNAEKRQIDGSVRAIIAPHAGYIYSGQIAANAYKQIEGQSYDAVVVVSPFHGFFKGVSVYSGGAYQTPIGVVEIDRKLSDIMSNKLPDVYSSTVGHTGSGGQGEHSLEVHLPFLQTVLGKFQLVAMVMGDQEESTIRAAAEVLTATLKGKNILMVASTDMSHYHEEKEARNLDQNFQNSLKKYNSEAIINCVTGGKAEACGFGPVAAVIEATRRLGGKEVEIISYGTSGEASGDFSAVVGYLSAIVTGPKIETKDTMLKGAPSIKKDDSFTTEEKEYLLSLARQTVQDGVVGRKTNISPAPTQRMGDKRGAFVTITKDGSLRGCIGYTQARLPLPETIKEMALAAAFEDSRFPAVTEEELSQLKFEISVMSPLEIVDDIKTIKIGHDGLMIRMDGHSGLLLPQVATENRWGRDIFLEQTCLKAGLPKNSYKDKQARIYKFSVEIIK